MYEEHGNLFIQLHGSYIYLENVDSENIHIYLTILFYILSKIKNVSRFIYQYISLNLFFFFVF